MSVVQNDITRAAVNTGCVFAKSFPPCPQSNRCRVQNCSGNCNAWISSVSNRLGSVSRRRRNSGTCNANGMQRGVGGITFRCRVQKSGV